MKRKLLQTFPRENKLDKLFKNSESIHDKFCCPVCNSSVPASVMDAHMSFHFDLAPSISSSKPKILNPNSTMETSTHTLDSKQESTTTAKKSSINVKSAFDVMMKASGERPRHLVFDLVVKDSRLHPIIHFKDEVAQQSDHLNDNLKWKSSDIKLSNFTTSLHNSSSKSSVVLTLRTNIPNTPMSNTMDSHTNAFPTPVLTVPVLKSMLQKATRRRLSSSACRLANHLCGLDLSEYLRRLPIIILEDGLLHPALPVAVWLMIAVSKGFRPPSFLVAFCIQMLVEVTQVTSRDFIPMDAAITSLSLSPSSPSPPATQPMRQSGQSSSQSSSQSETPPQIAAKLKCAGGGESSGAVKAKASLPNLASGDLFQWPASSPRTLLLSCLLRASYGGMDCDMVLLSNAAKVWSSRFSFAYPIKESEKTFASPTAYEYSFAEKEAVQEHFRANTSSTGDYDDRSVSKLHSSVDIHDTAIAIQIPISECDVSHTTAATSLSYSICDELLHSEYVQCLATSGGLYGRSLLYCFSTSALSMGDYSESAVLVLGEQSRSDSSLLNKENDDSEGLALLTSLSGFISSCLSSEPTASLQKFPINSLSPSAMSCLTLQARDLIPEGIDPHCDGGLLKCLVNAVMQFQGEVAIEGASTSLAPWQCMPVEQLREHLKSLVWFRFGCVNKHSLWRACSQDERDGYFAHCVRNDEGLGAYSGLLEVVVPATVKYRRSRLLDLVRAL